MHGSRRNAWLGLTPEPERELPHAVARLRARLPDGAAASTEAAERRRVERLVLHGNRRSWLGYLREVAELVADVAAGGSGGRAGGAARAAAGGAAGGEGPPGPGTVEAALVAGEVVLAHHQMLIGLPGPDYDRVAADRALLTRAVDRLRRLSLSARASAGHHPEAGLR
ncbi:hypothetical protein [Streptacidiphilus melanogenes]|uniref:hypothetical protein n=1 Tax=Streptacidiphilus melanogenes TaxID=411235 RepID=UPI0005A6DB74|nr:hypothetical protein [Streptacidiphilus melanogenes]